MSTNTTKIIGQADIKTVQKTITVGDDTALLASKAGVRYQIVSASISASAATKVRIHFDALAGIATKAILSGFLAANGNKDKHFGTTGPMGAVAGTVKVSSSAAANVEVVVQYVEV